MCHDGHLVGQLQLRVVIAIKDHMHLAGAVGAFNLSYSSAHVYGTRQMSLACSDGSNDRDGHGGGPGLIHSTMGDAWKACIVGCVLHTMMFRS